LTRRVLYLTGTRADFGLMLPTLRAIHAQPGLEVALCVTGMHLSQRFGHTVDDVVASGLPVVATLPVDVDEDSGTGMAHAAAAVATGFAALLQHQRPDICLLLGDRWEMLAAAMCATLAGVPIVHVCGGERSGSVDDALRHAISKLAHVHCVATEDSRGRLLGLGEEPARVHVVGTPGLVGIQNLASRGRIAWSAQHRLDSSARTAVVLFHPVVQDAGVAGQQMENVIHAVYKLGLQALCLMPNADSGNSRIRDVILAACERFRGFRAVTHLERSDYLSLIATADVLVGNSSSGIIEAASFGTPVVNVGDRQSGRQRNGNTVDCSTDTTAIEASIARALAMQRDGRSNIYGDGLTDRRITALLAGLHLDAALLKKTMTY
jgi:GDP/UDP-N,N'-diacetylbacillosamine 2-epimerase (hydrolysing)